MGLDDKNRPLYMISIAAELAGVHPQTLRSYEQKGLVTPRRTSGNTRMYSQADIDRLNLINELTSEGINLAGVTRILDLQSRLDEREEEVEDLRGLVKIRRLPRFENLQAACRRSVIVGHAAAPFKKKPRTGVVRGFHNKITVLRRRSTSCGPCPYART